MTTWICNKRMETMAEKPETLRQNMIIFRYQLLHIATGKSKMNERLNVLRPEPEHYLKLAKMIKEQTKQRNFLSGEQESKYAAELKFALQQHQKL